MPEDHIIDVLPDPEYKAGDPQAHGERPLSHQDYEARAFWDAAALAALTGLLAWSPDGSPRQYDPPDAAEMACEYADALLAERRARLKGRA